jgi:hypothetical protein
MLRTGDHVSGNDLFVVLKDKEKKLVVQIHLILFLVISVTYFERRLDPNSNSITTFGNGRNWLESRILCKALLLPLIQWRKHTFEGEMPATAPFGLITDDWEEMFADGFIRKPMFTQPIPPHIHGITITVKITFG